MTIFKRIRDKLVKYQVVYDLYHFQKKFHLDNFQRVTLHYNPLDLTSEYYNKLKHAEHPQLEHQIGRLTNFKKIIRDCVDLDGHFVEFGSWRGFSLLWIAYFMERYGIFNKKLTGLDGFVGLPYSDDVFRKGRFSNTSLKKCRKNIYESQELYRETKKNVIVKKFLYCEKKAIIQFFKEEKLDKFSFIHIDCDVSQSAQEIFDILIEGKLMADRCYILFDDYGVEQKLRDVIHEFTEKMKINWNIEVHSETRFTKNYLFVKKMLDMKI